MIMESRVDIVWLGNATAISQWEMGEVVKVDPSPDAIHQLVAERLSKSTAEAWLFWDETLGAPDPDKVKEALRLPGDVWHAGLRLKTAGKMGILDFINPTWSLNCDPPPNLEATSWRLSLRACLIKTDVLKQMGGVRPEFETLNAAALEMGHRFATRGVLIRHIPWLVPAEIVAEAPAIPFIDELLFVHFRFGRRWLRWSLARILSSDYVSRTTALKSLKRVSKIARPVEPAPYKSLRPITHLQLKDARVTVLIPTLDRYPYLRQLLSQLRQQTVMPHQVIVIDQTAVERRETTIDQEFEDLPLKVLYMDKPGQCSSRNAGLRLADGDYVLFVDDDDEVPPTLIESHLQSLHHYRADVSSGVANEVGAGSLPEMFTYTRASDGFPTNNTLIKREVLEKSGLFDLAYDRGQRADGDLGMRIYLSGALMVLNHEIAVLHHHAPSGGLRTHKARVITFASSRSTIRHRHIPSVTEIYLAMRYFTSRQVREMLWLHAFGTLQAKGGRGRKALKALVGIAYLPQTIWRIRKHYQSACQMMLRFPEIPEFDVLGVTRAHRPLIKVD
jgi:glycosyltransferase involved in cell wall biosynthesis